LKSVFNSDFSGKTLSGNYWTTTLDLVDYKLPYFLSLWYDRDDVRVDYSLYTASKSNGYSIRCIKEKKSK